uniref:Uncharacterized protein n=1 Tax=Arundo donax TaxID=35708 RepID=A0A0A9A5X9_ARUDO
MQEASLSQSQS